MLPVEQVAAVGISKNSAKTMPRLPLLPAHSAGCGPFDLELVLWAGQNLNFLALLETLLRFLNIPVAPASTSVSYLLWSL